MNLNNNCLCIYIYYIYNMYIYIYIILHLSILFSLRCLAGFDCCRPTNPTRESWAAQLPPLPTLRPLPLQRNAARYCVIIGDNEEGQVD